MIEPKGMMRVGVATVVVGLVLGIIVPFAQFGGVFPPPWILGVLVLTPLWGAAWTYLARRRNWWLVLLGQWFSLSLAVWLFFGSTIGWVPQSFLGGMVLGTFILAVWMVPVGVVAMVPGRR